MAQSISDLNQALKDRIEEIKKAYDPKIQALKNKSEILKKDMDGKKPSDWEAVIGVDFKVEWKDQKLSLDLPSVSIRNQEISLDLPEITKSTEHIALDVPDVRMVRVKAGEYPEFHGFTVKWSPIWIHVPEPYMRRVDIYYDLPSVTMRRQSYILGLPEFKMERVEWIMTLPEFTVNNVSATISDMKGRGEALGAEGTKLGADMKAEIEREIALFQGSIKNAMSTTKLEIGNTYNQGLGELRIAIDSLAAQGIDPIKVPTDKGDINLRKAYDDLDTAKNRAINEITVAIPV
jgi:hypothetical protein